MDNEEAARFIREKMSKVDVVIANAGEEDVPFPTVGSGMTRRSWSDLVVYALDGYIQVRVRVLLPSEPSALPTCYPTFTSTPSDL